MGVKDYGVAPSTENVVVVVVVVADAVDGSC